MPPPASRMHPSRFVPRGAEWHRTMSVWDRHPPRPVTALRPAPRMTPLSRSERHIRQAAGVPMVPQRSTPEQATTGHSQTSRTANPRPFRACNGAAAKPRAPMCHWPKDDPPVAHVAVRGTIIVPLHPSLSRRRGPAAGPPPLQSRLRSSTRSYTSLRPSPVWSATTSRTARAPSPAASSAPISASAASSTPS